MKSIRQEKEKDKGVRSKISLAVADKVPASLSKLAPEQSATSTGLFYTILSLTFLEEKDFVSKSSLRKTKLLKLS